MNSSEIKSASNEANPAPSVSSACYMIRFFIIIIHTLKCELSELFNEIN